MVQNQFQLDLGGLGWVGGRGGLTSEVRLSVSPAQLCFVFSHILVICHSISGGMSSTNIFFNHILFHRTRCSGGVFLLDAIASPSQWVSDSFRLEIAIAPTSFASLFYHGICAGSPNIAISFSQLSQFSLRRKTEPLGIYISRW